MNPGAAAQKSGSTRVMISGGGTGGHLYLGIAVARELQRRDPGCSFLFVGTRRGLESRIVPQEGFRLEFIDSAGLNRVGPLASARNLCLIPRSLWQAQRLVRAFNPAVVVGVGGYSSGPVVLAGSWLHRPTLIIEPNAYPGMANRLLAPFVDRVALALPDAAAYFRGKAEVTGIPVREEFRRLPVRTRLPGSLNLLIYGGSQGSVALNSIVCADLPGLKGLGPGLRLLHQTGEKALNEVRAAYHAAGVEAEIAPFFPRIYEQFGQADLILSRAGAGTVAEVTAAGKAAIFTPFPGAADDHQAKNALALQQHGAALVVREHEWEPGRLTREVRHLIDHPEDLNRMEEAARRLDRPHATRRIADIIEELSGHTRQRAAGNGGKET